MNPRNKVWFLGGTFGCLLTLAFGWLMIVGPQFSAADDRRAEARDTVLANAMLAKQVDALRQEDRQFPLVQQQAQAASRQLPSVAAIDTFTRDLHAAAAACGATITSITAEEPTSTAPAAAPAAPTTPAGSPPGSASTAPAPTSGSRVVAGGLYAIPVSLVASGTRTQLQALLSQIQHGQRVALVHTVDIAAGDDAAQTMTVTLDVFARPSR